MKGLAGDENSPNRAGLGQLIERAADNPITDTKLQFHGFHMSHSLIRRGKPDRQRNVVRRSYMETEMSGFP